MLAWIAENAVTIIVTAVILVLIGVAVFSLLKDKKNKKGGCTGNCANCGMSCSWRLDKEDNSMGKVTVKIDGMTCGMCEAHIADTIRKAFPDAKKVKASKSNGEATFLTDQPIDKEILEKAIAETGYTFLSVTSEPYKKSRVECIKIRQ